MKPEDPVLGLHFQGNSWAIPWWIIKNHHVANLTFDGQPVLIAFCENCSSGIAFDPIINGRRFTFHIAGVFNGSILLGDYETNSYWTPFTGEALEGPLKGTKLKQLGLVQCRWNQWRQIHPQGLVAYGRQQLREGHSADRAPGGADVYFLRLLRRPLDKRLPFNDPVLGVTCGNETRAYPLSILDIVGDRNGQSAVLNDSIGENEIVILHLRGSWFTTVFSRRLNGKTLQFTLNPNGQFTDSIHHSHWSYQGEALDGPVAGQKLAYVRSQVEEWYIWAAFHPATAIYGRAADKEN
jgi:hypothetical protein